MPDHKDTKLNEIDLAKLTIEDIMKLESSAMRMALAELLRRRGDLVAAIGHQNHGSHSDHSTHSTDGSLVREGDIERIAERVAQIAKRNT